MNRENINRLPCVGHGGQRCNCCKATSRTIRATRRNLKRRAIREGLADKREEAVK